MRERLARFMQGRYGVDQFSNFLVILALILMVAELFIPVVHIRSGLSTAGLLLLLYAYFRIFSKNHYRRYAENERFMKYFNKVRFLQGRKAIWSKGGHTVFINALLVSSRSVSLKEREKLRLPVQNAGQSLFGKAEESVCLDMYCQIRRNLK